MAETRERKNASVKTLPVLRIIVAPGGILRIETPVSQRDQRGAALSFVSKLTPAIRRLNKAAERAFAG